jgi:phosphopentomutase
MYTFVSYIFIPFFNIFIYNFIMRWALTIVGKVYDIIGNYGIEDQTNIISNYEIIVVNIKTKQTFKTYDIML